MNFTNEKVARVKSLIPSATSIDKATLLVREVTYEEVRDTMFHMPSNKAPGPDGYTFEFFKTSWSIVGEDVVKAVKGFFDTGLLLKEVNYTILSLVPKKVNPFAMGNFRPIACCSVVYKCITKIISNRMLPFLSDLVSLNQSALISSRSISKNVLLA
jgi:hypothetical protein